MSQKYLNIRKLEIPEIISNNIFLYRNFCYELLTKKYRAIRVHKSKQYTKQYTIEEDVLNIIIFLIQFDIYFISVLHILLCLCSLVGNSTLLCQTMRSVINVFRKGKYCLNCLKTFLNLMYPIYI